MGKTRTTKYTAKPAARRVKISKTNYRIRTTNRQAWFWIFALFGVLCLFTRSSFAQDKLEFMAEAVRSGTVEVKREALSQIRNLESEEASRLAVPALSDASDIVRATAAASVVFLPRDEAAQALLPLLQDKSELVRRETALALGKVRSPSAVNPLIEQFQKDRIAEVKNACIAALGEIGDVSAIETLIRILQNRPKKDNTADEFLRRSAARSIGQIAQIIQTGESKILTPQNFLPDDKKPIEKPKRSNLTEAFPAFRPALPVLIQTLQNSREAQDAKREAAFALGAIGDASAIPALQANLNNPDNYLAEISKEALKKISR